jgi:sugar lactone lactonase YvrE
MESSMPRVPALLPSLALVLACVGGGDAGVPDEEAFVLRPLTAERIGETAGMRSPESALYDEELDVFYISNTDGGASEKDGRAFIAVVPAETLTVMRVLVDGATAGVMLDAPKGLAIRGDTLWVTDIDVVRGFDRRSGAPVGTIDFASHDVVFLNDLAVGPNGALYVTESGVSFGADGSMTHPGTGRIFRIANRQVIEVARGESLGSPNGITWQDTTGTWLVAPLSGRDVLTWTEDGSAPRPLATGPGQYDGIIALRDGRILVSSWADSAVHLITHGEMTILIPNVSAPADIGYDLQRGVVAIPRALDGKVEYFQLRAAQ